MSKKILFVENDVSILTFYKRLFTRMGYKVEGYISPIIALQVFEADSSEFGLAILDVIMPEMNGAELLTEMKKVNPNISTLFISGCTGEDTKAISSFLQEDNIDFLQKPFSNEALLTKAKKLLGD